MTTWRLVDSGPCPAPYNMALDEAIATEVRKGRVPPTLRLYGWETPSVSLGSFQKVSDVDLHYCTKHDIPVVRRPTGGRAIFHRDELTYSFSAGNGDFFSGGLLDTYRQLSVALKSSLGMLGVEIIVKTERESRSILTRSPLCFRSTSYGELTINGKKLIGSAQKRWKDGFLQQGSMPYSTEEEVTRKIFNLASVSGINESMIGLREVLPGLDPADLKEAIRTAFERTFRVSLLSSGPSQEESHLAKELESRKYLSSQWNLQEE